MAKNINVGDIVEFREEKYKVLSKSFASPVNSFLIGGRINSVLLSLEPIGEAEEIGGWVSESRVKVLKRK